MPFYKAAWSMAYEGTNPLETFAAFYPNDFFVTEQQAYDSTQDAIWGLLNSYGIEDNDYDANLAPELSKTLMLYASRGDVLQQEPSSSAVKVEADMTFTYNPKDGLWHSGPIKITEPKGYNGTYKLDLPQGVTALCDHLNYVYAGETYELVSDHQPRAGERFGIAADIVWFKELKQYRPAQEVTAPDGQGGQKRFQRMAGAVVRTKRIELAYEFKAEPVGSLSITKTIVGSDANDAYEFELRLPEQQDLSGLYGDLESHNGVAQFSLSADETLQATNLPAGTPYEVVETSTGAFTTSSTNAKGAIVADQTLAVAFVNTYGTAPKPPVTPPEQEKPQEPTTPQVPEQKPGGTVPGQRPAAPTPETLPKTGDTASGVLLMCLAGVALTWVGWYQKRCVR